MTASHLSLVPADDAYSVIKKAISDAHYAPGDFLRESRIAEDLGVSRTPVREAIRRLEAEGWLEVLPNRGARVRRWSTRDVEEIFEARLLIEPYLVGQAVLSITDEQITELAELAERTRVIASRAQDAEPPENWFEANKRFHEILNAAAGNRRLLQSLQSMKEVPLIKWTYAIYTDADRERSAGQHIEIVQAVRAKNPAWAEAVMRCHILAAQASLMARLKHTDAEEDTE
jgi:DNA-binding GntR family transcriptional regulator